jgi:thiamine-monophosphate kinase
MGDRAERDARCPLDEFAIIAHYFVPLAHDPAALGLADDAAILRPREGQELVVTCDSIVEGVHFLRDDPPASIGHKALAVNLSDLAAKGAKPHVYLLALALPAPPSPAWLQGFAGGLRTAQERAGIGLVGGDTTATPGPLTISITAFGVVPQGEAVLRRGAVAGDRLYVSGSIGDGTLGLKLLQEPTLAAAWHLSEPQRDFLIARYQRPAARGALALTLRHYAHAAIDVSDGLIGDAAKLCTASGTGAVIEASRVPLSPAAAQAVAATPALLAELLTAGDDYEILVAIDEAKARNFAADAKAQNVAVTAIGSIVPGQGSVTVVDTAGATLPLKAKGYAHFQARAALKRKVPKA